MTSAAGAQDPSLGFALVRGDLPFRLQRRLGLIPPDGLGLVRRAVFWSMLGWLPVVLWAWYVGRVLPLAAAAVVPMLAALAVQVPARDLLLKLLKALL